MIQKKKKKNSLETFSGVVENNIGQGRGKRLKSSFKSNTGLRGQRNNKRSLSASKSVSLLITQQQRPLVSLFYSAFYRSPPPKRSTRFPIDEFLLAPGCSTDNSRLTNQSGNARARVCVSLCVQVFAQFQLSHCSYQKFDTVFPQWFFPKFTGGRHPRSLKSSWSSETNGVHNASLSGWQTHNRPKLPIK